MVIAVGESSWRTLAAIARPLDRTQLEALSPLVIIAPHADDETLGCGALLCAASELRLEARIAYLTDGSASHRGSPSWPVDRLVRARKAEALAALGELGIGQQHVSFLDWPDSAPYPSGHARYRETVDRMVNMFTAVRPRSIFAPWPHEAHCDHEAASVLADALQQAWPATLRRFDYMVWGWGSERLLAEHGADTLWALDGTSYVQRRRRALAHHRTQTAGHIVDAEWAFLIPSELAALTDRPTEVFLERR